MDIVLDLYSVNSICTREKESTSSSAFMVSLLNAWTNKSSPKVILSTGVLKSLRDQMLEVLEMST